MMQRNGLIAIVGPTATGKSNLCLELAARLKTEVVSADSAQVYRGLDIGTAKLPPGRRYSSDGTYIPHHLIDVVDPDCDFNIGRYQTMAKTAIAQIQAKGCLPILCGGSGLYVYSVINSAYRLSTVAGDRQRREQWLAEESRQGKGYLYRQLSAQYPRRAAKIHPRDYQRTLRALEQTEDLPAAAEDNWQSPYDLRMFGLTAERDRLYERINDRVEEMFRAGLVAEVARLLAAGYHEEGNALAALGYKEIIPHLRGEISEAEAKERLKRNTRHFAKRQLTWFRRDPRIEWLTVSFSPRDEVLVEEIWGRLKAAAGK